MQKLLSLFIVVALTAGFATAQEGIGLTFGLEFGIGDINRPEKDKYDTWVKTRDDGPPNVVLTPVAEDIKPYLWLTVGYENTFLGGALDVCASLAYDIGFHTVRGMDNAVVFTQQEGMDPGYGYYALAGAADKGNNPQNMYVDCMIGYNFRLGDTSTLSVMLGNENSFVLAPDTTDGIFGVIRPGVKFSQHFNPGDLHAQVDTPVAYLREGMEKDFTFAGLDLTLGWASTVGWGVTATGHFLFKPNDKRLYPDGVAFPPQAFFMVLEAGDQPAGMAYLYWKGPKLPKRTDGLTGISLSAYYKNGPIYAELALTCPAKEYGGAGLLHNWFDRTPDYGLVITPMFQYTFMPGLSAYASLKIDGLFARAEMGRKVDPGLTPAIGVKYSF
jgi:hypothetical protein